MIMDISNSFAILGLLATIVSGIVGTYLAVKRRYPGRLVFLNEQCIALFQDLVKNLPEMQVLYAERSVSENIVLLKGVVANTGSKDISRDMVSQPLCACLPEGFKWLEAKVVSASAGVQGNIQVDKNMGLPPNLWVKTFPAGPAELSWPRGAGGGGLLAAFRRPPRSG
jgi:hypothetical protein